MMSCIAYNSLIMLTLSYLGPKNREWQNNQLIGSKPSVVYDMERF
jgi:hypothetical protein